jgi:hypothetical protein
MTEYYYEDPELEELRAEVAEIRDWAQAQHGPDPSAANKQAVLEAVAGFVAENPEAEFDTDDLNALATTTWSLAAESGVLDVEAASQIVFADDIEYGREFEVGVERVERALGRELFEGEKERLMEAMPDNSEVPDVEQAWHDLNPDGDPYSRKRIATDTTARLKATAHAYEDALAAEAEEDAEAERAADEPEPWERTAPVGSSEYDRDRLSALTETIEAAEAADSED